jgi:hypothetical protein
MPLLHFVIGLVVLALVIALSGAVARRTGSWVVALAVAAFAWTAARYILFSNLLWHNPRWDMHWFLWRPADFALLVTVLVMAIVAILARKVGENLAWFAVVVTLVFAVLAPFNWSHDSGGRKENAAAPAAESTTTTSTQAPENCVDRYNVVLDANEGDRVVSQGIDVSDPAKAVDQIMALAQHDPRILVLYWNVSPAGKQAPISDWNTLVDNGCYTQQARDLYQQTLGEYKAATATTSEAPASGVNTGVTPGGAPFQETPGAISGDRTAVQIAFPNGDVVWAMQRCGNVVTTGAPVPGIPPKPTPTPPPITPPTTPTCPNGTPIPPGGECGKNDGRSPVYNPGIRPGTPGCNPNDATSAGPSGTCPGNNGGTPDPVGSHDNPPPNGCTPACVVIPPPSTVPTPHETLPTTTTVPITTNPTDTTIPG